MLKSDKALQEDLKYLEARLKLTRESIAARKKAHRRARAASGAPLRFLDTKPVDAARLLIKEASGRLNRATLRDILISEGAFSGSAKPESDADRSITLAVTIGSLIQDGEDILEGKPKIPRIRKKSDK